VVEIDVWVSGAGGVPVAASTLDTTGGHARIRGRRSAGALLGPDDDRVERASVCGDQRRLTVSGERETRAIEHRAPNGRRELARRVSKISMSIEVLLHTLKEVCLSTD
jgi:hypothetical protein